MHTPERKAGSLPSRAKAFLHKSSGDKRRAIAATAAALGDACDDAYFRAVAHVRYFFRKVFTGRHGCSGRLIVSLTSYPRRFDTLHLTLKTLLAQRTPADLVVLWVHAPDAAQLPARVLRLRSRRFVIREVPCNLMSFKKLAPALAEFPDAFIAIADDDVFYNGNWLRELARAHASGGGAVVGHRGHVVRKDDRQRIRPYNDWAFDVPGHVRGPDVFLTGAGGILFPPACLPAEAADAGLFLSLCPTADDVWWYFMLRRNGVSCEKIAGSFRHHCWSGSQAVALHTTNRDGGGNDVAVSNLVGRFGVPF